MISFFISLFLRFWAFLTRAQVHIPVQHRQGKFPWPEADSIVQNFSLPSSLMYYMAKNPSRSKCYQKMIQSCKYFFEKNAILPVAYMYSSSRKTPALGITIDRGKELKICANFGRLYDCHTGPKCCVDIDGKTISAKFWLPHCLSIDKSKPVDFVSQLCTKIYKSDIRILCLGKQQLSFENFKTLAASAEVVYLNKVPILNHDRKSVTLENIIESAPYIKKFLYAVDPNNGINLSLKNLIKFVCPKQLKFFALFVYTSSGLDLDDFCNFLEVYKNTGIFLKFDASDTISEELKTQLNTIMDNAIYSGANNLFIYFPGYDPEKAKILYKRFHFDLILKPFCMY